MKIIYLIAGVFFWVISSEIVAQTGRIEGRVYNARTNEPLPFTNIIIYGTNIGSTSDLDGRFIFTGVTPGYIRLVASSVGYETYVSEDFLVTNARTTYVELPMTEKSIGLEEIVVKASPFTRNLESPLSLQRLNISEIERSPGANRDVSKVIQILPGVAGTPVQRNDVIVRGGGPSENAFYLDGIEIPIINHFATQGASGGPVGIINPDFIREINFYSGAFPASRGNALSSVLDFRMIDPNKDQWNLRASLGATDLSLTVNGPVTDNSGLIFSYRRSYLQFLFDVLGLPFLPTYDDYQLKYRYDIDRKNQVTLISLGALDRNRLNLGIKNPDEVQQYILGYLPENNQWSYMIGGVYRHFGDRGFHTLVLSRNMLDNRAIKFQDNDKREDLKIFDYQSQEAENRFRYEYTGKSGLWDYQYGAGLMYSRFYFNTFQKLFLEGNLVNSSTNSRLNLWSWNVFSQASRSLLDDRLSLSAGIRMDANDYSSQMSNPLRQISPRISASYNLISDWYLNGNIGRYYQRPPYTTLGFSDNQGNLVNRDNGLRYISVDHYVGGVEFRPDQNSRITLEGFYKYYDHYPFSVRDSVSIASKGADFGIFGNEEVVSTNQGRAYGVELFARSTDFLGFNALLSYTYVRSQFKDREGNFIPATWDNKHLLNITVLRQLKRNWNIGAKWRFVGGPPYTPFDENLSSLVQAWNAQGGPYLDYSQFNALRLEPFHQLDVRIDKQYYLRKLTLMFYVDIQNLYNFQSASPPFFIRETDEQGNPVIANPDAPPAEQRYSLKKLQTESGTVLPTLGIIIEF